MGNCFSEINRDEQQGNAPGEDEKAGLVAPQGQHQHQHQHQRNRNRNGNRNRNRGNNRGRGRGRRNNNNDYRRAGPGEPGRAGGAPRPPPKNFQMQFIYNQDYIYVTDCNGENIAAYNNNRNNNNNNGNRNVTYIASFRNSKIGTNAACCPNLTGLISPSDNSKLRMMMMKIPLKNLLNVSLYETNCLKNPWFWNKGHCFGLGLIGIRKNVCNNNNNVWRNVHDLVRNMDSSSGLLSLIENQHYINSLGQYGINVHNNDVNIVACSFTFKHNCGINFYQTFIFENTNETKVYDSTDTILGGFNDKCSLKLGDTVALKLNRPRNGNYNTISFIKNNSDVIGDKYIPIRLNEYYYQYMIVSKGCDCSPTGNFKFGVSYS